MAQKVMYPGMVNSPETTITNGINESDTIIYVLDPTRVPIPPNLMTLGTGTNAETIKVTEINDNALTVERGFQGIAKSWPAGTVIARNFTAYDYDALRENIEDLEASKETPAGAQAKADEAEAAAKTYADQEVADLAGTGRTTETVKGNADALAAHLAETVTDIVNVKTGYGAKGDGVTDDTTAIQAALDALPALGGTIFIPAGTYVISSPISLKSGVRILGAGKTSTKIVLSQDVDGFQVFGTSENRLTDIYIGYFTMFSNTTGGNQRHIYLQEAENVTIEHLHLEGASNNAINVFTSSHIRINSVDITASGHFGILVYQSDNVSVTNCRIWDIKRDGAGNLGLQFKSSQYCQAIGNRIENVAGYGIYLWTDGTKDCVGNIIIGNIIRNLLGTANTGEFARVGIYINESPQTIIEGNVVSNTTSTGINLLASNGCRVSGNILEGTPGGGIGLVLNSSQNVIINNLIRDWDSNGIAIETNRNYVVFNTVTEGRLSASSLAAGIRLRNGASNNFIIGNDCSNNQRRGILEEGTATPPNWNYFRDNVCVNNGTSNFGISGTNSVDAFNITNLTAWPTFKVPGDMNISTFIQGPEIADPVAPPANFGKLFYRDNGSGKTQLCVRFPTGAVQVLATEP